MLSIWKHLLLLSKFLLLWKLLGFIPYKIHIRFSWKSILKVEQLISFDFQCDLVFNSEISSKIKWVKLTLENWHHWQFRSKLSLDEWNLNFWAKRLSFNVLYTFSGNICGWNPITTDPRFCDTPTVQKPPAWPLLAFVLNNVLVL